MLTSIYSISSPSVVDICRINNVSRVILSNVGAAFSGMVSGRLVNAKDSSSEGYETLVFHATGVGGRAMEDLVRGGFIQDPKFGLSPTAGPEVDEHGKSGGHKYKGSIYMVHDLIGLHYYHVNQVLHRDIKADHLNCYLEAGAKKYGPLVDMCSVGCIFAELLHGKPILTGKTEPGQLNKIFELCGLPEEINWPGVSRIP
ncbi:hypothetical protein L2E82_49742 [Cichorium intybus]|uniref:Uncharacterized protein n=1 Tax=Cichorium intybus TaxID=13427 RepID=A0ACB8Z1Z9_CICIN|nr:hypothetical protein L2E82_49742 [Cichorium intybus]